MSNRDLEIRLSRDWLWRTGFWFGLGVIQAICVALLFGAAASYASSALGWPKTDATDASRTVRSGMKLRTDHGTGCQYLESSSGYLIPRLDGQGLPICGGDR